MRRAIKLNFSDTNAWITLAECLWKKAEYVEAKESLLSSIKIQPTIDAYILLSMLAKLIKPTSAVVGSAPSKEVMLEHNKVVSEESISYAKSAINIDINNSKSWYILGNAYCGKYFSVSMDIQDLNKSITCYNKALGLLSTTPSPSASTGGNNDTNHMPNPDLYYNKAELCMYVQNYTQAVEHYTIAHQIDPSINRQIPDILAYIEVSK